MLSEYAKEQPGAIALRLLDSMVVSALLDSDKPPMVSGLVRKLEAKPGGWAVEYQDAAGILAALAKICEASGGAGSPETLASFYAALEAAGEGSKDAE